MSEDGSADSTQPRSAWPGLLAIVIVGVGLGVYGLHEHGVASQATEQSSQTMAALNATRAQVDALSARLDQMTAQKAAEQAAVASNAARTRGGAIRARKDDPRWKKVQDQLENQGKQIESTQQELTSARTELGGSIARTHDELVLLEKKGERNYTEFDLDKSGNFQREGPVGLRLRKANTKRSYADLEMMVDDYKLSQKHVNVDQPVVFYSGNSKQPIELVINNISKNHIHGYLSQAKYKPSELQAVADANNTTTGAGAPTSAQERQKLEAPSKNPSPK